MKKKKHNSLLRFIFVLFALIFIVGGLITVVKVANTSTESRSKAAEIISILKPSWEFDKDGDSEGWEAGNFAYSVTSGLLTGTILGKPVPLPLDQSLEAEEAKKNKPKKQNRKILPDNSGQVLPITKVESYLVNNSVNVGLPRGLKGVAIRMAVSLPEGGYSIGDSDQAVSAKSIRVFPGEPGAGNSRKLRNDCTECTFGRFCPLLVGRIPGFCPMPSPVPRPSCTPIPPPCEGVRCPKFPTVIPPGGWCPPNQVKVLKFRVDYNAINILPQATPRSVGGNSLPPSKPLTKPIYFDVVADGQLHDYQVQFPNIDTFDLRNLKIVFAGAPAGTKISFDWIRLVGLAEITPTITPIAGNPVNWNTQSVSLSAANFYIEVDGKRFLAKPDSNTTISVGSDLPNGTIPDFTTLELMWRENGVEMRLYLYFERDNYQWWPYEIRTYNGRSPGDWVYYKNLKGIGGNVGEKFASSALDLYSTEGGVKGIVHFDKLLLQAFLTQYINPTPTPPPCPVTLNNYDVSTPCESDNYRYVSYSCTDGYLGKQGSATSCKSTSDWKRIAYDACVARKCTPTPTPVACTLEARICPDGSSVGRVPPSCAFAPCPE